MSKEKKRDPIKIMLRVTVVLAVVAVASLLLGNAISGYRANLLKARQEETVRHNEELQQQYAVALAEHEAASQSGANQAWPAQKLEGWDVVDLTNYPLENVYTTTVSRADIMNGGMLLINQWHSQPADYTENGLVRIADYIGWNNLVFGVPGSSTQLQSVAVDALNAAFTDAKAAGLTDFTILDAYRTMEEQQSLFQSAMDQHASRYSGDALIERTKRDVNYPGTSEYQTGLSVRLRIYKNGDDSAMDQHASRYSGDALIERTKRDVNYPGTSEYQTGLSVRLRIYKNGDDTVNNQLFSQSAQGIWMAENSWKYGLVFRFPLTDYPVPYTTDKSYKTGVSSELNIYRYVGKGNAAVMHTLDLCLEEYIEYLMEHPHIAVFEDGVLRYEIYRQQVGEADTIELQLTGKTATYDSSLDNMGGVITVFSY